MCSLFVMLTYFVFVSDSRSTINTNSAKIGSAKSQFSNTNKKTAYTKLLFKHQNLAVSNSPSKTTNIYKMRKSPLMAPEILCQTIKKHIHKRGCSIGSEQPPPSN